MVDQPATRMDLQRFQRLLEKEEISTIASEVEEKGSVAERGERVPPATILQTRATAEHPATNVSGKENHPPSGLYYQQLTVFQ